MIFQIPRAGKSLSLPGLKKKLIEFKGFRGEGMLAGLEMKNTIDVHKGREACNVEKKTLNVNISF